MTIPMALGLTGAIFLVASVVLSVYASEQRVWSRSREVSATIGWSTFVAGVLCMIAAVWLEVLR